MPYQGPHRRRLLIPLAAFLLWTGCGGGEKTAVEQAPATPASTQAVEAAAVDVPDACTFFTRAELEPIVGWELRDGKAKDAPPGSSVCDFEVPPGMYVTRTFPSPALPKSVGFSSLQINTHTENPQSFGEFRRTLGAVAQDVPGIGDGAYFNGPDLLYVRVGNRGFSVRIYTDVRSDPDRAKIRDVMLKLGAMGASRLE